MNEEKKQTESGVTLSDAELIERVGKWVTDLARSGGNAWSLSVPVNFNRDPDMLISELIKRFTNGIEKQLKVQTVISSHNNQVEVCKENLFHL